MTDKKELNHKYLFPTFLFSIIAAYAGAVLLFPSTSDSRISFSAFFFFVILLFLDLVAIKRIYGKLKLNIFSVSTLISYCLITLSFLINSKEHGGLVYLTIPLLTLLNISLITNTLKEHFVFRYAQTGVYYLITKIIGMFGFLYNLINTAKVNSTPESTKHLSKHAGSIAKTLLIFIFTGFPILLIVIGFLSNANPEFGAWMNKLVSLNFDDELMWTRIVAFIVLAFFFIGEFFFLKEYVKAEDAINERGIKISHEGNKTILRVMLLTGILLNVFYLVFVIAELRFDFAGAKTLVQNENVVRYSDLAVNRFWELIYVSIINLGFVYFLTKPFKDLRAAGSKYLAPLLNVNVILIAISTLFLIYSALNRMGIYQAAYGFTNLRLLAYTFTMLLAVITVLIVGAVWVQNHAKLQLISICLVGLFLSIYILLPIDYITNKINYAAAKSGKIEKFDAKYTYAPSRYTYSNTNEADNNSMTPYSMCYHSGDTASNDGLFVAKEILNDKDINVSSQDRACLEAAIKYQKDTKVEWYNFNLTDYLLQK